MLARFVLASILVGAALCMPTASALEIPPDIALCQSDPLIMPCSTIHPVLVFVGETVCETVSQGEGKDLNSCAPAVFQLLREVKNATQPLNDAGGAVILLVVGIAEDTGGQPVRDVIDLLP